MGRHCHQQSHQRYYSTRLPATGSLITTDQDLLSAFRTRHPTHRKRRTVNDTFEDAAERRQKARRLGGSSIAAAAAVKTDTAGSYPTFSHRRSVSGSSNHAADNSTRRIRSSKTVVSGKGGECHRYRRRRYYRDQEQGPHLESSDGRDAASRFVAKQALNDEEFKLVYHQVYKGTQFAFRQHIEQSTLQPHADALREVVDRLLILFCTNPLENGRTGLADKLTPGGRKAFESASAAEAHTSPFASAPIVQTNMHAHVQVLELRKLLDSRSRSVPVYHLQVVADNAKAGL
ncbi:hypothetical protein KC356_g239 [Hortaea werneckii]|nr:hypothetical protein KC356_g239 [Hortaea werneckii]